MTIQAQHLRVPIVPLRLNLAHWLPSLVVVGYGVFILSLFVRHALMLYINPAYVWPTTAAGVVLVGLAGVTLARRSKTPTADSCCATDSCGCSEPPARLWQYAALCLPLLLAAVFPPRGLSNFSALQRGPELAGMMTIRGAATVSHVSLSVDTRSFTLQDWAGALSADPNPKDYTGKPVGVTGIVLHDRGSVPPGYIMVMRYQITCCIADARPIGLIVRDTSNGALKEGLWVKVSGRMGAASYQGQKLVVVEPIRVVPTKAGNPYLP